MKITNKIKLGILASFIALAFFGCKSKQKPQPNDTEQPSDQITDIYAYNILDKLKGI